MAIGRMLAFWQLVYSFLIGPPVGELREAKLSLPAYSKETLHEDTQRLLAPYRLGPTSVPGDHETTKAFFIIDTPDVPHLRNLRASAPLAPADGPLLSHIKPEGFSKLNLLLHGQYSLAGLAYLWQLMDTLEARNF